MACQQGPAMSRDARRKRLDRLARSLCRPVDACEREWEVCPAYIFVDEQGVVRRSLTDDEFEFLHRFKPYTDDNGNRVEQHLLMVHGALWLVWRSLPKDADDTDRDYWEFGVFWDEAIPLDKDEAAELVMELGLPMPPSLRDQAFGPALTRRPSQNGVANRPLARATPGGGTPASAVHEGSPPQPAAREVPQREEYRPPFVLDEVRRTMKVRGEPGEPVEVEPEEFALIQLLVEQLGKTPPGFVSRKQLEDAARGRGIKGNPVKLLASIEGKVPGAEEKIDRPREKGRHKKGTSVLYGLVPYKGQPGAAAAADPAAA